MFLKTSLNYVQLIWAQVHIGHSWANTILFATWFLQAFRQGLSLINLWKFLLTFSLAINFFSSAVACSGPVWFINLERSTDLYVRFSAQDCGEFSVTTGWIGGLVSNTMVVFKAFLKLRQMSGTAWAPRRQRFYRIFSDFLFSRFSWPRCLLISSVFFSQEAGVESVVGGTPGVGIVDTNTYSQVTSSPVPGNDDSFQTIVFYNQLTTRIILNRKFFFVVAWFSNIKVCNRLGEFREWLMEEEELVAKKPKYSFSSFSDSASKWYALGVKSFLSFGASYDNTFEGLDVFEISPALEKFKSFTLFSKKFLVKFSYMTTFNFGAKTSVVSAKWFKSRFASALGLRAHLLPYVVYQIPLFHRRFFRPYKFRDYTYYKTLGWKLSAKKAMDSLILYTFLKAYRNLGLVRFRLSYLYRLKTYVKRRFFQDSFTWMKGKKKILREKSSSYPKLALRYFANPVRFFRWKVMKRRVMKEAAYLITIKEKFWLTFWKAWKKKKPTKRLLQRKKEIIRWLKKATLRFKKIQKRIKYLLRTASYRQMRTPAYRRLKKGLITWHFPARVTKFSKNLYYKYYSRIKKPELVKAVENTFKSRRKKYRERRSFTDTKISLDVKHLLNPYQESSLDLSKYWRFYIGRLSFDQYLPRLYWNSQSQFKGEEEENIHPEFKNSFFLKGVRRFDLRRNKFSFFSPSLPPVHYLRYPLSVSFLISNQQFLENNLYWDTNVSPVFFFK